MTFREFLKNDTFASTIGIELTQITEKCVKAKLTVLEEHLNAGGACQGGVLFGMADFVFAAVTNYGKKLTFTISANISFHKSGKLGDVLEAVGTPICTHNKIPSCEVRIYNQEGDLLASFSGVGYTKNVDLPVEGVG